MERRRSIPHGWGVPAPPMTHPDPRGCRGAQAKACAALATLHQGFAPEDTSTRLIELRLKHARAGQSESRELRGAFGRY